MECICQAMQLWKNQKPIVNISTGQTSESPNIGHSTPPKPLPSPCSLTSGQAETAPPFLTPPSPSTSTPPTPPKTSATAAGKSSTSTQAQTGSSSSSKPTQQPNQQWLSSPSSASSDSLLIFKWTPPRTLPHLQVPQTQNVQIIRVVVVHYLKLLIGNPIHLHFHLLHLPPIIILLSTLQVYLTLSLLQFTLTMLLLRMIRVSSFLIVVKYFALGIGGSVLVDVLFSPIP